MSRKPARQQRPAAFTLLGIGAATAAAHIGNNFTTYLVGGLIDRFGFTPSLMGAWNMAETLSYATAMFVIAPRARALDVRLLAMLATALVALAQAGSALTGAYPLLLAGRIGTGLGFGLMNSAVNLAAGRTAHPARWISLGISVQTVLYALVSIGVPMIGAQFGVRGMFFALAALSLVLGLLTLLLPGGPAVINEERTGPDHANPPIGQDRKSVV